MRQEHEWDDDLGLCTACGTKRETATPPAAPPRPAPRPIVVEKPAGAADGLARKTGGARKPTAETRAAFASQTLSPAPAPRETPATESVKAFVGAVVDRQDAHALVAAMVERETISDVATIPDPIAATIAVLELERSEIDVTIETLRRLQGRKVARA
jgi:hypothetical protein